MASCGGFVFWRTGRVFERARFGQRASRGFVALRVAVDQFKSPRFRLPKGSLSKNDATTTPFPGRERVPDFARALELDWLDRNQQDILCKPGTFADWLGFCVCLLQSHSPAASPAAVEEPSKEIVAAEPTEAELTRESSTSVFTL